MGRLGEPSVQPDCRPQPSSRYHEEEEMARSQPQAGPRYDSLSESLRPLDQPMPGPTFDDSRKEQNADAAFAQGPTSVGPGYEELMDRGQREVMPRYENQVLRQCRELTPERYAQPEYPRERVYPQEPSMLNKV